MDYTALTTAVDFAGAMTAIGAVAATVAVLFVGIRGARIVLGFVKRQSKDSSTNRGTAYVVPFFYQGIQAMETLLTTFAQSIANITMLGLGGITSIAIFWGW